MKTIAQVLMILGAIGTIYFGFQAYQDSESFNVLGSNISVSSADWTPLIISVIVLVVGFVLRKK